MTISQKEQVAAIHSDKDQPEKPLSEEAAVREDIFQETVQPFLKTYCFKCHDGEKSEAGLALNRFQYAAQLATIGRKAWTTSRKLVCLFNRHHRVPIGSHAKAQTNTSLLLRVRDTNTPHSHKVSVGRLRTLLHEILERPLKWYIAPQMTAVGRRKKPFEKKRSAALQQDYSPHRGKTSGLHSKKIPRRAWLADPIDAATPRCRYPR